MFGAILSQADIFSSDYDSPWLAAACNKHWSICGRAAVRILLPLSSSSGTQLAFWLAESSRKRVCVVRVQADQRLHKSYNHRKLFLKTAKKYDARVFSVHFAAKSAQICGRCCRIWSVTRSTYFVNTAQRASVWGWPPTSWSWSAMERAAGTRRTVSVVGSTRTWVRPGSRRRREGDRHWKVMSPALILQGIVSVTGLKPPQAYATRPDGQTGSRYTATQQQRGERESRVN